MSATSGQVEEIKWQQHTASMTGNPGTGTGPRIDHGTLRIITGDGEKVVKSFSDVSPGGTLNGYRPPHNGTGAASIQTTPPQSPSNACKVGRKDESQTTPRAHNYYEKMFASPEARTTSFSTMVDPKTPVKDSFSDISEGLCPLPPTASPRKPPRVRIQPSTTSLQAESPQLQTGLTPMAAQLNLSGVPAGTASTIFGPSPQASPRSAYQQVQQSLVTTEPSYLSPIQTFWWNADPRTMPEGLQTYGQPSYAPCPQTVHSSNSMAGYPVGLVPINSAPVFASQHQQYQQQQQQQYQQHFQTHGPLASGVSRGGMEHQLPQPNFLWPIYTERDGVHCPPPPQVLHRSPNKESGKAHIKPIPSHTPTPVTPAPRQGPAQLAAERSLKTGLSSIVALQNFGHLLTPYEKGEILQYPEVWYVGKPGCRKLRGPPSCAGTHCANDTNTEYDDSRGDYRVMVGDHVQYRYEIVGTLGKGSFGQVLKCIDHAMGTTVALKVIRNKRRFQKQARVEAALLGTLMAHMPDEEREGVNDTIGPLGVVQMLDHFVFRSHLCITFELLGANLYEHIKAGGFAGCSPELVWSVGIQVLRTLSFLKSLNIVHCDLKPENILLPATVTPGSDISPSQTKVKVIDFGSSCYVDQRVFTYIQSRFYRAPEVILGLPYGPAIDMWSIACVLAELLTGAPLFPGEDETEQVACITEILGPPPVTLLKGGTRASLFFDVDSGVPRGAPPNSQGKVHRPGSVAIETALRGRGSALFLDFLKKCLLWDPEDRLTPEQALQHPWLAGKVNPKHQTTNSKGGSQRESSRSSVLRYLVPNKSNNNANACSGKGPLGSAAAALGINIF